jgi:hypothetical protein
VPRSAARFPPTKNDYSKPATRRAIHSGSGFGAQNQNSFFDQQPATDIATGDAEQCAK